VSTHEIARRVGIGRSTVRQTLKRAEPAGLAWPLPESMNDAALEAALYASPQQARPSAERGAGSGRPAPRVDAQASQLVILWDEYIAAYPGGYSYSRFCELYRAFGDDAADACRLGS
jgi:transposase